MQKIAGTLIKASCNGRPLTIQDNGRVGKLTLFDKIEIEVQVLSEPKTYAITVDGGKNITLKKNHGLANSPIAIFRFETQVKEALDKNLHVEYPENNMRLIRVNPNGSVDIPQIAVVSQNSMFFIATETTYENCCFQNAHEVVCPQFEHRPKLTKFLKKLLQKHIKSLPPIAEYQPKIVSTDGLPKDTTVVLWYNIAQRFGALYDPHGAIRVHQQEIIHKGDDLAFLQSGQLVKIKGVRIPTETGRKTTFKREAFEVEPL